MGAVIDVRLAVAAGKSILTITRVVGIAILARAVVLADEPAVMFLHGGRAIVGFHITNFPCKTNATLAVEIGIFFYARSTIFAWIPATPVDLLLAVTSHSSKRTVATIVSYLVHASSAILTRC